MYKERPDDFLEEQDLAEEVKQRDNCDGKDEHEKNELRKRTPEAVDQVIHKSNDEVEQEMRREALIKRENAELTNDDVMAVQEIAHTLISDDPAFQSYFKDLVPRLNVITDTISSLRASGKPHEAISKLIAFLREEKKHIKNISKKDVREKLENILSVALNIDEITEREMDAYTKATAGWDLFEAATGIEPIMKMRAMVNGETTHGDKLTLQERMLEAAKAIGVLGVHVGAGILTGGVGNALLIGVGATKAAGTALTINTAVKDLKALALLHHRTKDGKKAAKAFLKVSDKMRSTPKFGKVVIAEIERTIENRKSAEAILVKREKVHQ